MVDKLLGFLIQSVVQIAVDRLVAAYRIGPWVELVTSLCGLALIVGGGVALCFGWLS